MRPPFLFLLGAREKEKRRPISALRAALRSVARRNAAAAAGPVQRKRELLVQTWVEPYSYPAQRNAGKHFSRFGTKTTHLVSPTAAAPSCKIEVQYNRRLQFCSAPGGESKGGGRSPLLGRWGWGFQRGRRIGTPSPWRVFRLFLHEQKGTAGSGRAGPKVIKFAKSPLTSPAGGKIHFTTAPRAAAAGQTACPAVRIKAAQ